MNYFFIWDKLGAYRKDKMKIGKNNFVVTFKTEKEVSDYIGMHIPEEQRLLWLGFFIANNYIAQWLEDQEKKEIEKDIDKWI